MQRGTMLEALGAAAAGTTVAKRPVGHRSTPIDDRSPKTQSSFVHKNLIIFCGATTGAAGPIQWAAAGTSARTGSRRMHDDEWIRRRFDRQHRERRLAATSPATVPLTSRSSLQCSSAGDPLRRNASTRACSKDRWPTVLDAQKLGHRAKTARAASPELPLPK